MAEEVWYVSYDIQEQGGYTPAAFTAAGAGGKGVFPPTTQETNAINTPGGEGFTRPVSTSKNVEVWANSAAEAAEVVREKFGQNAGKVRVLAKPNTNFKVIA